MQMGSREMQWKPVRDKDKYGVVIHNFQQDGELRIKLYVGDTVHIFRELGDWYFGCATKNKAQRGIFPKSFIYIKDSVIDKTGNAEVIIPRQPLIVQEITSVLREWGQIWKHLYVTHGANFERVRGLMYELVACRSKILSENLPVDELKELKQLVTSKIDKGNNLLGLDLVVRNEQGNLLNPDVTSTLQLYRQHEMATQRIKRSLSSSSTVRTPSTSHHNHMLFVSVRNFVCKMTEDAEVLIVLYDACEMKPISENYVVRWSKEGLCRNIDQMNNLRVLFTDLGSRDIARERVFLVAYVIRIGAMEAREPEKDPRHSRNSNASRKSSAQKERDGELLRRPFGVAAKDITDILSGRIESDEDKDHIIPFIQCGDRDHLDGTLKKIIGQKDMGQKDSSKGQALWCNIKLLHGDLKQARDENPHFVFGNVSVSRKMGFPETILPGDVRNDLYLTLIGGEYAKGSKTADKNVEVCVKVCDEKGKPLSGVIQLGSGIEPQNEYRSTIYYHEDKPKWFETLKIAIAIDDFYNSHLKFTFKHRSSNEYKDRSEKPFAISYVRLKQENGTTLRDTNHDLLVYKVDHKKYSDTEPHYLHLPSTRLDLQDNQPKPQLNGLSLSNKDSFAISSTICSTKLTQNVTLLGLLEWWSSEDLCASLRSFMRVDGEEVVKFLQDVLDALFSILMQHSDSDKYDKLVFECLIYIIGLVSDRKYQHFQPVLDVYIKDDFSATLAYSKLLAVLKQIVDSATTSKSQEMLLRTFKCLLYLFKFIVRSRQRFVSLNEDTDRETFRSGILELFQSLSNLMLSTEDCTLVTQGACLKYLPSTIADILTIFDAKELSELLVNLICNLPPQRLTKQKMMTVNDLVHSRLFLIPECRAILLPLVMDKVKELLEGREEIELCVKILSDTMEVLHRKDVGPTSNDIQKVMMAVLRTIIQAVVAMDAEDPLMGNVVAVMISIFRQMNGNHYRAYLDNFATPSDLLDYLMEIMCVFQDLVSRSVYPGDWCEMIMLQNSVILKSLKYFSQTIRERFLQPFEFQVWNNYFHCSIKFLTQPSLQLETFSEAKRARILSRYHDMRREAGFDLLAVWFSLGQHKIQFVPAMVGQFLEMTLLPETELRKGTIPIFFDMMQCEFYAPLRPGDSYSGTKGDQRIRANFNEFENEMVSKLDHLVEGGRGDAQYNSLFKSILCGLCEKHATLKDKGLQFVTTVADQMERLLEYRSIAAEDENHESRMSCTVSLLDFYNGIGRREMYIRYLDKLCDMHLEWDNYTEAAYTLKLHSEHLTWADEPLAPILMSRRFPEAKTHRLLKEALYYEIIEYFAKGKMWECALNVCKELEFQYEEHTFAYGDLSKLHIKMSGFYENILKQTRPEPEYFRVAFYGRGFPRFLQNKVFVYRGREYERLSDFSNRTLNRFPRAELMNKLDSPSKEVLESPHQLLQVNKVDPVMEDRRPFTGKAISSQILRYYRVNDVRKFIYSRKFHRMTPGDSENEFANLWLERTTLTISQSLPGILQWCPVINTSVTEINPLQNAIETMRSANQQLRELINEYCVNDKLSVNPLSLKLNGMVDPAVMGGIANYETVFLCPEYLAEHPEEESNICLLQELVACQIPLLDVGLQVHRMKTTESLAGLQQRMEECFSQLKAQVEAKYGKRTCDLKAELNLTSTQTATASSRYRITNSLEAPFDPQEGRISSLTRSQVSHLSRGLASLSQSFSNLNSPAMQRSLSTSSARSPSSSSFYSSSPFSPQQSTPTKVHKREKSKSSKKEKREQQQQQTGRNSVASNLSWNSRKSGDTQWYDSLSVTSGSVIELSQQLTAKRPLRSEVERERRNSNSRPSSGHFLGFKACNTNNNGAGGSSGSPSKSSSNRDSIATTDSTVSTASEEDSPPPLPLKHRETVSAPAKSTVPPGEEPDYCNIPERDIWPQGDGDPEANFVSNRIYSTKTLSVGIVEAAPPIPPPKKPPLRPPTDYLH